MNDMNNLPAGFFPLMMAILGVCLLIGFWIYYQYIKNLADTLKAVRPQNRQMPPAQVWLLMISFLSIFVNIPNMLATWSAMGIYKGGFIWTPALLQASDIVRQLIGFAVLAIQFRIVTKISESIAQEYASRNMHVEAKPTYQTGLIYCVCSLAAMLAGFLPGLRWLGIAIGIAGFICWIMYWVKTAEYKKQLRALPAADNNDSPVFNNLY